MPGAMLPRAGPEKPPKTEQFIESLNFEFFFAATVCLTILGADELRTLDSDRKTVSRSPGEGVPAFKKPHRQPSMCVSSSGPTCPICTFTSYKGRY